MDAEEYRSDGENKRDTYHKVGDVRKFLSRISENDEESVDITRNIESLIDRRETYRSFSKSALSQQKFLFAILGTAIAVFSFLYGNDIISVENIADSRALSIGLLIWFMALGISSHILWVAQKKVHTVSVMLEKYRSEYKKSMKISVWDYTQGSLFNESLERWRLILCNIAILTSGIVILFAILDMVSEGIALFLMIFAAISIFAGIILSSMLGNLIDIFLIMAKGTLKRYRGWRGTKKEITIEEG